jgi:hypothetical protein
VDGIMGDTVVTIPLYLHGGDDEPPVNDEL